ETSTLRLRFPPSRFCSAMADSPSRSDSSWHAPGPGTPEIYRRRRTNMRRIAAFENAIGLAPNPAAASAAAAAAATAGTPGGGGGGGGASGVDGRRRVLSAAGNGSGG
ncbi:unnamed protein product, partial [Scytosiphon promiscuus]